ncbi:MAG: hypothetical protein L6R42_011530 [Xanthoria sp. 1 TBL-2021]|nr:MAG: hypothetical protein L6R42_011530 [Xanthoria sp. 1 TBL-2021]
MESNGEQRLIRHGTKYRRPTSNAEEEEHFTDESELSTPRRTPSPDPDTLTEEDANTILEKEDLPAVPGTADMDWIPPFPT